MTLEELYAQIDGSYAEIVARMGSAQFVSRFIVRFLDDRSIPMLISAWELGDESAAFHAAHTAKGVCANLALTRLASLSDQICEALREGNEELRAKTDVAALVNELRVAYDKDAALIRAFADKR